MPGRPSTSINLAATQLSCRDRERLWRTLTPRWRWRQRAPKPGPLVRPVVRRLVGLDLSPRMLDKARELGVYDGLEQANAVGYLRHSRARFDLVLAADVLIYIVEIDAMFAAVSAQMDRGVFCFSVEALQPSRGDFELLRSLRYAHAET